MCGRCACLPPFENATYVWEATSDPGARAMSMAGEDHTRCDAGIMAVILAWRPQILKHNKIITKEGVIISIKINYYIHLPLSLNRHRSSNRSCRGCGNLACRCMQIVTGWDNKILGGLISDLYNGKSLNRVAEGRLSRPRSLRYVPVRDMELVRLPDRRFVIYGLVLPGPEEPIPSALFMQHCQKQNHG